MAEHGDRLSLGLTVLALLRELQVPATLFVISGHLAQADPAYLAQALADGHTIGHHMHEDSVSARLSPAAFRQAFDRAAADLRAAAAPRGLPLHWFRPGGGWIRPSMLRSVAARGYRLVLGWMFPGTPFTHRWPGCAGLCCATPIPAQFSCCTTAPTPCQPRSSC